jgi:four helix bundle protein
MKGQKFRKLNIWNKSMAFVSMIYKSSEKFPNRELYGLTQQLRRAAISISLNIAEGSASSTDKEFKRFLSMSLRSIYEVMCGIEISNNLGYIKSDATKPILNDAEELAAMVGGLIKKLDVKAES